VAEPGSPRAETPSDDWHATAEPGQPPLDSSTDALQDAGASRGTALPEVAASAVEAASTSGETATEVVQQQSPSVDPPMSVAAASVTAATPAAGETAAEGEVCPDTVTIQFDYRSTVPIMTGVEEAFAELTTWLKENPQRKVSVEGHADAVGSDQYNLMLSYERAGEVARLLSEAGTAMERIIVVAAGSHHPIDGVPPDAGENRRAIVELEDRTNCQQTPR
jgi:outer membrane protein OmpA-like peptidoglycan-associated protein